MVYRIAAVLGLITWLISGMPAGVTGFLEYVIGFPIVVAFAKFMIFKVFLDVLR